MGLAPQGWTDRLPFSPEKVKAMVHPEDQALGLPSGSLGRETGAAAPRVPRNPEGRVGALAGDDDDGH